MAVQNKLTFTLLVTFTAFIVSMETKSVLELDDVTVAVDDPFKYQIGDKKFLLQYRIHRIVDKNTKSLPEWLTFDNTTNLLYGTPRMPDIGTYPIRLKAACIDPSKMECQEKISRTFIIRIVEPIKSADSRGRANYNLYAWNGKHHGKYSLNLTNHALTSQERHDLTPSFNHNLPKTNYTTKTETNIIESSFSSLHLHEKSNNFKVNSFIVNPCEPNSPSFTASLLLHVTHELSNANLLSIVSSLSAFVSKPLHLISLSSSVTDIFSMASDNKYIITAGPGNVVESLKESIELSWHLACEEFNHVSEFARVMQHNIEVGRLSQELGLDTIAWYIYSDRPISKRVKRDANLRYKGTRTPTHSLMPSSSLVEVSRFTIPTTGQPTIDFSSLTESTLSSSFNDVFSESSFIFSLFGTSSVSGFDKGSISPTPVTSTNVFFSMKPSLSSTNTSRVFGSTSLITADVKSSSISLTENASFQSLYSSSSTSTLTSVIVSSSTSTNALSSIIISFFPVTTTHFSNSSSIALPYISSLSSLSIPQSMPSFTSSASITLSFSLTEILSKSSGISSSFDSPFTRSFSVTQSSDLIETNVFKESNSPSRSSNSLMKESSSPTSISHNSSQILLSSSSKSSRSSGDAVTTIDSTTAILTDGHSFTGTLTVSFTPSLTSITSIYNYLSSLNLESSSTHQLPTESSMTSFISLYSTIKFETSLMIDLFSSFSTNTFSVITLSEMSFSSLASDLEKDISILISSSNYNVTYQDSSNILDSDLPDSFYSFISYSSSSTILSTRMNISFPLLSLQSSFVSSSFQADQRLNQTSSSVSLSIISNTYTDLLIMSVSSPMSSYPSSSVFDFQSSNSFKKVTSLSSSEIVSVLKTSSSDDIASPFTMMSSLTPRLLETSTVVSVITSPIPTESLFASVETSSKIAFTTSLTEDTSFRDTNLKPSVDTSLMTPFTPSLSSKPIKLSEAVTVSTSPESPFTSMTLTFSIQEVTSSSKVLTTSSVLVPPVSPDDPPILQNSIDHLPIVFGKYFVYRIPANAFNDSEDGNTRNLTLSISLLYGKPIPLGAWLKFNSTSQTLYGIPLQQDFKDNADLFIERFVLIAADSQNQLARDVISLTYSFEVLDITHRISLSLDYGFDNFHMERQNLVYVADIVAGFYGNANLKYLTFFDVTKGSVVVRWGNNSLFGTICYKDIIVGLFSRMANESGVLTPEFADLLTVFNPVSVQLELSGPCLLPQHTPLPPFDSPVGASDSDKMWIEILLPALIVILVLVIIALVLLICCRHKKPSKEPKTDKPMFLEDRRPIIFPEELEMVDPSLKPKQPLILPRDYLSETPPAVPPHGLHELPSYHVPEINEDLFKPINSDDTPPPPSYGNQGTSEPPPYRLPPPYFNPHRSNVNT